MPKRKTSIASPAPAPQTAVPFGQLPAPGGKFVYLRKGLGGEGAEVRPLRENGNNGR